MRYRPTFAGLHRDYLRKRRAEEPGVPARYLLREMCERGYEGSSNLLVRYIHQGRGRRPPGLDLDIQATTAALTMPHHNGRTEGVKAIKDQDNQKADATEPLRGQQCFARSWS
jgi:hypothetical protein